MLRNIEEFFAENRTAALAFSGGVDSSFLFYAAKKAGADLKAYYVKTSFQPAFELEDAKKVAEELGGSLTILTADVLSDPKVRENSPKRCYFCKKRIFSEIIRAAAADGYHCIIDGTNFDDDADDRPGMAALTEMGVRSPLRECGYGKQEIREQLRQAGLFTWNKPSYACLATRIQTNEIITPEKLQITEKAESFLFGLGFSDFRVRLSQGTAKIQVREKQMQLVLEHRELIRKELEQYYGSVVLDLKAR